jgi:hypothetical protein
MKKLSLKKWPGISKGNPSFEWDGRPVREGKTDYADIDLYCCA